MGQQGDQSALPPPPPTPQDSGRRPGGPGANLGREYAGRSWRRGAELPLRMRWREETRTG